MWSWLVALAIFFFICKIMGLVGALRRQFSCCLVVLGYGSVVKRTEEQAAQIEIPIFH